MPRGSALESRILDRLAQIESRGLTRVMRPPSGADLSSNDYLNLATHPRIREAFAAGIARDGCGSTGSRLLRGDREGFAALEARFARFKGTERALYFSSGYLANLAVLTGLSEAEDVFVSDERNHASLIDGMRLSRARTVICPHNDIGALACLLRDTPCTGVRFVVVESLYSMDGDMAPLRGLASLCEEAGAVLIVDEAHAVGVYGEQGSGLIEEAGLDPSACVSINTAGKALGAGGALVAGPAWMIEYLVQLARPFVFSTAPPPALADALLASLDVIRDEPERRQRLRSRSAYLRQRLCAAGIEAPGGVSQIVPVMIGENDRAVAVARAIQAQGFDVRAIRPPTVPPGTARLRVSVNAGISEETIDRFVGVLAHVLQTTSVPA